VSPRLSTFLHLSLVALSFVLSRLVYLTYFGVKFYVSSLDNYIQYLDPQLLRTDLLRSVYYLHFQPPAFNLFLGAVLQLFPDTYPLAFQIIYLAMGLAFSLVLFLLLRKIGVYPVIATILAVIHTIIPTTLIHENWLFYSYPIALLLCSAAYFLLLFLDHYRIPYGLLFFSCLTLVSFIHAMFGLLWFSLIIAAFLLANTGHRARIARCAALPFLFVLALAVKHYALFGTFTVGSSYTGLNLAWRLQETGEIPVSKHAEILHSSNVPPFFFECPLFAISQYPLPPAPATGVPALDAEFKSTGSPNYNNIAYIKLGDAYWQGAREVIENHPHYYFNSFKPAIAYFAQGNKPGLMYFHPANDGLLLTQPNSRAFTDLTKSYNGFCTGQPDDDYPGWILVIALPVLTLYGLVITALHFRRRSRDPRRLALAFIVFNIFYSSGLTIVLSCDDWARYRFAIDAFFLVLLGLLLTWTCKTLAARKPASPA
jgi:hypothetical protein